MATVIRHGRIEQDSWKLLDTATCWDTLPEGDYIVPLACLHCLAATRQKGRIGVALQPIDDPATLASHLDTIAVVAVHFPRFTDGRGYSIARRLRDELRFRGELRAVGDVLRDQLFYLARCGFDAFALRADQDAGAAIAAFTDFSASYQRAADRALPLFRRRTAA